MMLLAGDIGGTKTNLALWQEGVCSHLASFPSQSYPHLGDIIRQYLETLKPRPQLLAACFAIAGPVHEGVCKATNLPWIVDAKAVAQSLRIPHVFLINDLEANAYAIDHLNKEQLITLYAGEGKGVGNRAVISPGTGLGEAGLFWDGKKHTPFASEGGHGEFGPHDEIQIELARFLIERFGHPSYERVLSGPGFSTLYDFFTKKRGIKPSTELVNELSSGNHAAIISKHAFAGTSSLCEEIMTLFVSVLGAEAGNCALKYMAFGGIYLGGGIPPKILPALKAPAFLEGFLAKGRMKSLLQTMPIQVILDDKASLRGAFYYCTSALNFIAHS